MQSIGLDKIGFKMYDSNTSTAPHDLNLKSVITKTKPNQSIGQ